MTDPEFGYRRYFRIGPVTVSRVGSWNRKFYPRFGVWRGARSLSIRWRAVVVVLRRGG